MALFFKSKTCEYQKVILCYVINKDFDTVWRVMDVKYVRYTLMVSTHSVMLKDYTIGYVNTHQ